MSDYVADVLGIGMVAGSFLILETFERVQMEMTEIGSDMIAVPKSEEEEAAQSIAEADQFPELRELMEGIVEARIWTPAHPWSSNERFAETSFRAGLGLSCLTRKAEYTAGVGMNMDMMASGLPRST
ncbi:MAG: hypothetical protein M1821_007336 [Bathelium mastoideum]|nr:MAG: hypothetical protein M1821_007336 [Bathelium mastoideum]